MKKRFRFVDKLIIAAVFFFLISFNQSIAQRRYFGNSYLAGTPPAEEFELEIWQTSRLGKAAGDYFSWRPQLEVEYGITDYLVTSFFINFESIKASNNSFASNPLGFHSASLELRYRLTNPDEYFIDPSLYFEYTRGKNRNEYEPKIILSKRIGKFISAINIAAAIEDNSDEQETETEFEITFGLAYDLNEKLALGFELKNNSLYEEFYDKQINQAFYCGPTLVYGNEYINIVLSGLIQVSGSPSTIGNLELLSHEKYEVRMLVGVEL